MGNLSSVLPALSGDQTNSSSKLSDSGYTRSLRYMLRASQANKHSYFVTCDGVDGKYIEIDDKKTINFASCSYLGLELDTRVKRGAIEAIEKYGTQFSCSRTFLSIALYQELEHLYAKIFGSENIIIAPTTTLAHAAAIPVVVDNHDVVFVDRKVHNSVQMAIDLLNKRNIKVVPVNHNDMTKLEQLINEHKNNRRIWYFGDGVYSMSGSFAPLEQLEQLRDKYPNFYLYLDDAHGMSWTGTFGRGYVLEHLKKRERTIVAVSHAKGFGTAGGTLIFADELDAEVVKAFGATLIFGGPIQPPTLGASVASAKIHTSLDLVAMQEHLKDLLNHTLESFSRVGVPLLATNQSPIRFVKIGTDAEVSRVYNLLLSKGFYTNPARFPAVARNEGGIRFTINAKLSFEDIDHLAAVIASAL